ncbi:MAG: hypothetical protein ACTSRU_11430 [Candidatus Hodarchaeales archaeon]
MIPKIKAKWKNIPGGTNGVKATKITVYNRVTGSNVMNLLFLSNEHPTKKGLKLSADQLNVELPATVLERYG